MRTYYTVHQLGDTGATLIVVVTVGLMLWSRSKEDHKRIGKLQDTVEALRREVK